MRLVVGPHPDDAVLGCGSYLSECRSDVVLTVFDGVPHDGLSEYDASCGFDSSVDAMRQRIDENERALATIGVEGLSLGWLDLQYAPNRPHTRELAQRIEQALHTTSAEGLIAPLGVQHPDHVLVSDACLFLANRGVPTWLYEELPYRVVWPEHAQQRHERLRENGWHLAPDFLGGGAIDAKQIALGCYASQKLDVHCCLVPERFWAVVT